MTPLAPRRAIVPGPSGRSAIGLFHVDGALEPVAGELPEQFQHLVWRSVVLGGGDQIERVDPLKVLTQIEPIAGAIDAYEAFDRRKSGWIKVELNPVS